MTCQMGQDISLAAELLREGKLVAFATETVYGLGAHALDETAAARIFAAKERPTFDPLIVHIADRARLHELVLDVPEKAHKLAEEFWPGPLTLVLPKRDIVPGLITSGLPNVAVRIPAHPVAQKLLQEANIPIAAPSANLFGQVSPTSAEHVREQLGERIDYILDGGSCTVGLESTVVAVDQEQVTLLRPGGTSLESIEAIIGTVQVSNSSSDETTPQNAPGMLAKHYAPGTPLTIVSNLSEAMAQFSPAETGLLLFGESDLANQFAVTEQLSAESDLTEAAVNFFAAVRRLDKQHIKQIVAVPFPEQGLGRALNDRLRRASIR
ncbi:MAG: threonylcarbamoyl-AMP synthase [Planctomycetaceae bacterium]|nr:threonylcarbamoyl-AMP synthase [Planctomycetaceae bacterium]